MAVFFTAPAGRLIMAQALYESRVSGLSRLSQGKVRDIYAVDDDHLLIVTTDRLSAFDVVLPDPIPGKGEVLTKLSEFWFARTADIVPNHMAELPLDLVVADAADYERIHHEFLTRLPGVARVRSAFTLRTVLERTELPIK